MEKITYILKLKNTDLYLKNFNNERIYSDSRNTAYQFDPEKSTHEKLWQEINERNNHTLIKRTEVTRIEYEEVSGYEQ